MIAGLFWPRDSPNFQLLLGLQLVGPFDRHRVPPVVPRYHCRNADDQEICRSVDGKDVDDTYNLPQNSTMMTLRNILVNSFISSPSQGIAFNLDGLRNDKIGVKGLNPGLSGYWNCWQHPPSPLFAPTPLLLSSSSPAFSSSRNSTTTPRPQLRARPLCRFHRHIPQESRNQNTTPHDGNNRDKRPHRRPRHITDCPLQPTRINTTHHHNKMHHIIHSSSNFYIKKCILHLLRLTNLLQPVRNHFLRLLYDKPWIFRLGHPFLL